MTSYRCVYTHTHGHICTLALLRWEVLALRWEGRCLGGAVGVFSGKTR
jgi:hypothetical protein